MPPHNRVPVPRRVDPLPVEPLPPAPPAVAPVVDDEKESRLRFVFEQVACAQRKDQVVRALIRTFAVTREQAQVDYDDAKDQLAAHIDDEAAWSTVVLGSLARVQMLRERAHDLAMDPVEENILDRYGPDPDRPLEGALYRKLTPGERASEVGSRVAAGKFALACEQTIISVAGRRTTKFADKPQLVLVQSGASGLSEEDKKLLSDLGMVK